MPGPSPTPTRILEARGSWRAKTRSDEPKIKSEAPCCPGYLSTAAHKEWRRLCKLLAEAGILTKLDQTILAIYCEVWDDWLQAKSAISAKGWIVKSKTGHAVVNPWIKIHNTAIDQLVKIGALLGLDPSSRTKIRVGKLHEGNDLELKYFTNRPG